MMSSICQDNSVQVQLVKTGHSSLKETMESVGEIWEVEVSMRVMMRMGLKKDTLRGESGEDHHRKTQIELAEAEVEVKIMSIRDKVAMTEIKQTGKMKPIMTH